MRWESTDSCGISLLFSLYKREFENLLVKLDFKIVSTVMTFLHVLCVHGTVCIWRSTNFYSEEVRPA